MNLFDLIPEEEIVSAPSDLPDVDRICHRTGDLSPGAVFVCMKGRKTDSHTLIDRIGPGDAAALVIDARWPHCEQAKLPFVRVRDTRRTWAMMWSRFCSEPQKKMRIYGITGTNGKTSTACFLARILSCAGRRCALIGTLPVMVDGDRYVPSGSSLYDDRLSTMTTPDPDLLFPLLRELYDDGVRDVVMEVSSQALDAERVAPICFATGAFCNLSPEHLDSHGDMESYAEAKSKLFFLSERGVVNADDPWVGKVTQNARCPLISVSSAGNKADYSALGVRYLGLAGVSYTMQHHAEKITIDMQIPGRFSVENSLLAAAVATEAGVRPSVVRCALANIKGVSGRMEKVDTDGLPFSVFIDYAHTPAAFRSLLLTFRPICAARIIVVFGCGGDRDRGKRRVMGAYAQELADVSIITSDNPRTEDPASIIDEIVAGFDRPERYTVVPDREQAIGYAVRCAGCDDVVLIVGKGHEEYEIKGNCLRPFFEKEIVAKAVNERKKERRADHES